MSALALMLPVAAAFAGPGAQPTDGVRSVESIVVIAVASRARETIDATPATVSVIGREDLDRNLSHDLRSALQYEPGVSVENGATRFGFGNISIRGLEGNRVQMLQDGIRLPDNYRVGSFSNAGRNPFELGLLSRIEILRGPGSALYGSDALAGVVSMTTIDPSEVLGRGGVGAFAQAGYGDVDQGTSLTGAGAGRIGRVEAMLAASRADGHERKGFGDVGGIGSARTQPNPQDATSESWLAKIVVPTAGGGRVRGTWERFERQVLTDVLSLNPQSTKTVSLTGDDRAGRERLSLDGAVFGLGPVDHLAWLVYHQDSETAQDTVEERANTTAQCLSANGTVRCRREARFRFEQRESGVTLIGQSAVGVAHRLVYGIEAARIETEESRDGQQTNLNTGAVTNVVGTDSFPTRDFPKSRLDRTGVFGQDEIQWGAATVIPALRYDRFRMTPEADAMYTAANPGRVPVGVTDSAWSPKLGALVPIGAGTTMTIQLAAGFRAPPYFDVNIGLSNLPLGYTVIANPDLEPETSRGLELGIRGRHATINYAVTAYLTDYSDLIVSRAPLPCPGDPRCVPTAPITFQSQNITRARIEGFEVRGSARLDAAWTAKAGFAWSRGEDRSKGVPLNSVDPAKLVAGVAWSPNVSWGAEATGTFVASKSDIDTSAGALRATPGYGLLDLVAWARLTPRITVNAGIFNAFDKKYWLWSDVRGLLNLAAGWDRYTQPGRNAAVQVKVTF